MEVALVRPDVGLPWARVIPQQGANFGNVLLMKLGYGCGSLVLLCLCAKALTADTYAFQ